MGWFGDDSYNEVRPRGGGRRRATLTRPAVPEHRAARGEAQPRAHRRRRVLRGAPAPHLTTFCVLTRAAGCQGLREPRRGERRARQPRQGEGDPVRRPPLPSSNARLTRGRRSAGFAGAFIDREVETRGLDFIDTEKAKYQGACPLPPRRDRLAHARSAPQPGSSSRASTTTATTSTRRGFLSCLGIQGNVRSAGAS